MPQEILRLLPLASHRMTIAADLKEQIIHPADKIS
jgi:hypothetical protein